MSGQKKYVYKFTFPNGKVYIGTTSDPATRWQYGGTLYASQNAVGYDVALVKENQGQITIINPAKIEK